MHTIQLDKKKIGCSKKKEKNHLRENGVLFMQNSIYNKFINFNSFHKTDDNNYL